MTADESLLLAIGTVLTALALISGYFILAEVLLLVREWSGSEQRPAWRRRQDVSTSAPGIGEPASDVRGDTGPLVEPSWRERIQPMRDPAVVKQLIDHLSDEEPSQKD